MGDRENRQRSRQRLRERQLRERGALVGYERAADLAVRAEAEYAAAIARAEAARLAAREAAQVALAALAATVMNQQLCAELADVTPNRVRTAVREADAGRVEEYLRGLAGDVPPPTDTALPAGEPAAVGTPGAPAVDGSARAGMPPAVGASIDGALPIAGSVSVGPAEAPEG